MDAIEEIIDALGIESTDEMSVNESYTVQVAGFEDLTIEKIGPDRISVAHHYVQRGDLMCDPEVVFRTDGQKWTPIEYTHHPGIHEYDETGLDLSGFLTTWDRNLRRQGFVAAAENRRPDDQQPDRPAKGGPPATRDPPTESEHATDRHL